MADDPLDALLPPACSAVGVTIGTAGWPDETELANDGDFEVDANPPAATGSEAAALDEDFFDLDDVDDEDDLLGCFLACPLLEEAPADFLPPDEVSEWLAFMLVIILIVFCYATGLGIL